MAYSDNSVFPIGQPIPLIGPIIRSLRRDPYFLFWISQISVYFGYQK